MQFVTVGKHEIASVSPENIPRLFSEGSSVTQLGGLENMYTAADWSQIDLHDCINSVQGRIIRVQIKSCE